MDWSDYTEMLQKEKVHKNNLNLSLSETRDIFCQLWPVDCYVRSGVLVETPRHGLQAIPTFVSSC